MNKQPFVMRITGSGPVSATCAVKAMFGEVYVSAASDAMFESVRMPSLTGVELMPPAVKRLPYIVPQEPGTLCVNPYSSGYNWCLANWGSCSDIDPWTVQFLWEGLDENYLVASEYIEYMKACKENLILSKYAGKDGGFFGYADLDENLYFGAFYAETVNFIPYKALLKLSSEFDVIVDTKYAYKADDICYICFVHIRSGSPTAVVAALKDPAAEYDRTGFHRKGKKSAYFFSEYVKRIIPGGNLVYADIDPGKGWDNEFRELWNGMASVVKHRFVDSFITDIYEVYDFSTGKELCKTSGVEDVAYKNIII